jgi:hypothetical protein
MSSKRSGLISMPASIEASIPELLAGRCAPSRRSSSKPLASGTGEFSYFSVNRATEIEDFSSRLRGRGFWHVSAAGSRSGLRAQQVLEIATSAPSTRRAPARL